MWLIIYQATVCVVLSHYNDTMHCHAGLRETLIIAHLKDRKLKPLKDFCSRADVNKKSGLVYLEQ